jgi:hypothetical protein
MFDLFFTKTQNNQKLKPNPNNLFTVPLYLFTVRQFPKKRKSSLISYSLRGFFNRLPYPIFPYLCP